MIEEFVTLFSVKKRKSVIIIENDYFRWRNSNEKALFILFVLAIGFALSACSKSSDASAEQKTAKKEATATEKKTEEKTKPKRMKRCIK